jgi:uncharacterized membrane protein YgaE (UPF0421/DUF939 family)
MMLGLVIGILVGETVLLVAPPAPAAALIALLVSLATMAAISFGLLPVIAIQGGVSALLVLALGPAAAGAPRFLDALVGTGVGLVFSQVLLTPDPARLVHAAAAQLLRSLADALARLADAVEKADAGGAVATRARLIEAREDVNLLQLRIATAASLERWSLRGRWRRRAAERAIERYADRGALLHAAALVLADAMAAQLQADAPPPRRLAARLRRDGAALDALQRGKPAPERMQEDPEPSGEAWRPCLESLEALERLVDALSSEPDLRA